MKNNLVKTEIDVKNNKIGIIRIGDTDYISLTDLAKYSNQDNPANVIIHWMSNKGTYDYIGLWEQLNNENFNFTEFREIKIKEVGYPSFTLSPRRWIKRTNAEFIKLGIIQSERLVMLNESARNQMKILKNNHGIRELEILQNQVNENNNFLICNINQ